jgi:hypothetical protein
MAFLELHDDEAGNSLVARCPPAGRELVYDYDYQLEMYVDQILDDYFRPDSGNHTLVCVKMFAGSTPEDKTHSSPLVATWKVENGRRGEQTLAPLHPNIRVMEIIVK